MAEGTSSGNGTIYRYRFANCEFDELRMELRVAGIEVAAQRRPLEVLALLLRHAGQTLSRETIHETLWAGRITADNVVGNAVLKLRAALGELGGTTILSPRGGGYRFEGELQREALGERGAQCLEARPGQPVPQRPTMVYDTLLARTQGSEVWRIRHPKTRATRVLKFAVDDAYLASLKREVTLSRMLVDSLGERDDLARILDWQFEQAPFFIECEDGGENLDAWARTDARLDGLDRDARIALFLQIADAVAAAHAVGVLHKDLKPSNVLIAPREDGGWQCRLADFGSARLLEPERLDALGITRLGLTRDIEAGTHSGTLLYLAPEVLAGEPPTVASDVYALGLMLWQLLSGALRRPMAPGWEAAIGDALLIDDIAAATDGRPAQRLSSVRDLSDRLRALQVRRVALEQDRARAARIAHTEQALARSRARRPWVFAASATLLVGLLVSASLYWNARSAWKASDRERARAEATSRFLQQDLLWAADPFTGRDLSLHSAVARAAERLDTAFDGLPSEEIAVRETAGSILARLGDYAAAEIQFRTAGERLTEIQGAGDPATLRLDYARAQTLVRLGRFDDATALLQDADARQARLPADARLAYLADQSWALHAHFQQRFAEAIPRLERAIAARASLDPDDRDTDAHLRASLSQAYTFVGRAPDGERVAAELLSDLGQSADASALRLAQARIVLARARLYQGRTDAAVEDDARAGFEVARDRLGIGAAMTMDALNVLCSLYGEARDWAKSRDCQTQAVAAAEAGPWKGTWVHHLAGANLGIAEYHLGHYAEATTRLAAARTGLAEQQGEANPMTQAVRFYLADGLRRNGSVEDAIRTAEGLDAAQLLTVEPTAPWAQRVAALRQLLGQDEGAGDASATLDSGIDVSDEPVLREALAVSGGSAT